MEMAGTEMEMRGRLENMAVLSFRGHTDDVHEGVVVVRVHMVSSTISGFIVK